MKPLKSKKGFTLIELVIVIALMGLILVAISAIIINSTLIYSSGKSLSIARDNVVTIAQTMKKEIRFAGECKIMPQFPATPDTQYQYFYLQEGKVYSYQNGISKPLLSLSEQKEQNYRTELTITSKTSSLLELIITVYQKNEAVYTSSTQVSLSNASGSIAGTTGACIQYRSLQE